MHERIYLYPLWLRLWHWSNAFLFFVLIVTGFSLHFAGTTAWLIDFKTAVFFHNVAGFTLGGLYLFFVVASILSGNYKHYIPKLRGLLAAIKRQARFYLYGIFVGEPHPYHATLENRFNPLQQITYLQIMYLLLPLLTCCHGRQSRRRQ